MLGLNSLCIYGISKFLTLFLVYIFSIFVLSIRGSKLFSLQTIKIYNEIKEEETKEQITLNLKKFNSQKLVIKNRIVLYTINRLFGSSSGIEKIHLQDIIKLCGNNIGNKFLVPNKKVKVLVKSGKIFFIVNK